MCMSARDYNYNKKEISIISPIMPYKIIMRISEKEYSFECFNGKNIIVTPPMNNYYDLSEDFRRSEFEYNMTNKTIDDFITTCEKIYMYYVLDLNINIIEGLGLSPNITVCFYKMLLSINCLTAFFI